MDKKDKIVSFDLIIDFKDKTPKQIRRSVEKEMKEKHSDYQYYVIVDNDFSG